MRWYYLSHFTRYRLSLEKIPLHSVDKHDALGEQANQRGMSLGLQIYPLLTNWTHQAPPPKVLSPLTTPYRLVDVLTSLSALLPRLFLPM